MENQDKEVNQETKAKKAAMWSQLMGIGLDFAFYLFIPLILFIYGGKWLDAKFHHKFFVLIGLFLALSLSWYLIYKKIKAIKNLLK